MEKYIVLLITVLIFNHAHAQNESFGETIKFLFEDFSDFAGNNKPLYVIQDYDEKNCIVNTRKGKDSVVFHLNNTSFDQIGFGSSQYNLYVFLPPTEVVNINGTYYDRKYNLSGRGPKFIPFDTLKTAWEHLYTEYCNKGPAPSVAPDNPGSGNIDH